MTQYVLPAHLQFDTPLIAKIQAELDAGGTVVVDAHATHTVEGIAGQALAHMFVMEAAPSGQSPITLVRANRRVIHQVKRLIKLDIRKENQE